MVNPIDTRMGRRIVTTDTPLSGEPRLEMTWTMTSPTTSSSIAALVRITPRRVDVKLLERRRAKVVPRLVEQRAAPAAKLCSVEAFTRGFKVKDKPTGIAIPVRATPSDSPRLALRDWNDVSRPPKYHQIRILDVTQTTDDGGSHLRRQ